MSVSEIRIILSERNEELAVVNEYKYRFIGTRKRDQFLKSTVLRIQILLPLFFRASKIVFQSTSSP